METFNLRSIFFFITLIIISNVFTINLREANESFLQYDGLLGAEGCSIRLKKTAHTHGSEAISFISEIQDNIKEYSSCKINY